MGTLRLRANLVLWGFIAALPLWAQTYQITDLKALPGDSKSVACGGAAAACGLNSLGQAAGTSSNPSAATATLFNNGTTTNLNTLGAEVSVAISINNTSEVVGYFYYSTSPSTIFRAFLYSGGHMTDISDFSLFPSGAQAWAINNPGEVVGQGWVGNSSFHAFLYSGGHMTDLGGGYQSTAVSINDTGQIVGNATGTNGAFLYSKGQMIALGAPSGATSSSATAINNNGEIAGTILFSAAPSHPGIYSNGKWTDLGAYPGAIGASANGINSTGQIVGNAGFPVQSYHPFKPGKHVPFVVKNGTLTDLNTLVSPGSGFTITGAYGINDSGQILCNATNASGAEHAVLLTPK
jgi:probable HAF family extracellular repeat protein